MSLTTNKYMKTFQRNEIKVPMMWEKWLKKMRVFLCVQDGTVQKVRKSTKKVRKVNQREFVGEWPGGKRVMLVPFSPTKQIWGKKMEGTRK